MKIERLELTCGIMHRFFRYGLKTKKDVKRDVIMWNATIPLNQKVIKDWVDGMNKIERGSFYSILSESVVSDRMNKK